MAEVYVLQNQRGDYLTKQGEWADGSQPQQLYRTVYKDEAVNQQFEVSSKDFNLRLCIVACQCTDNGVPCVPVSKSRASLTGETDNSIS